MMTMLMSLLERIQARFMALSRRERGLVFLVPFLLAGFLLFDGVHQTGKQLREQQAQIAELRMQAAHAQAAQAQLERDGAAGTDPVAARQRLQSDIADQLAGSLSPDRMQEVLRTLLAEHHGVSVLALESRPAERVSAVAGPGKLYRHALELTLSGDYFNILKYLAALEKQTGIHWQKLDYEVKGWPANTVRVELFTLSLEEVLIRA
ncbi:MAG: hypothetical protein K0S46_645 [Moraxellaceae bacterium]|jgi:MSHA biogenesis protein MshJ|nr:hypothetical protein [Moraxellaceae bacterium]